MKILAIFFLVSISICLIDAQQLIDVSDVYNQMFRLSKHCKAVIDRIDHTLRNEALPQDEVVFESSIPLLKDLQLQIIRVSCQTIVFGSTASQKATLTEALNGSDEDVSDDDDNKNSNAQQP